MVLVPGICGLLIAQSFLTTSLFTQSFAHCTGPATEALCIVPAARCYRFTLHRASALFIHRAFKNLYEKGIVCDFLHRACHGTRQHRSPRLTNLMLLCAQSFPLNTLTIATLLFFQDKFSRAFKFC